MIDDHQALPGNISVGRIIGYRNKRSRIYNIEELGDIGDIGKNKLAAIKKVANLN